MATPPFAPLQTYADSGERRRAISFQANGPNPHAEMAPSGRSTSIGWTHSVGTDLLCPPARASPPCRWRLPFPFAESSCGRSIARSTLPSSPARDGPKTRYLSNTCPISIMIFLLFVESWNGKWKLLTLSVLTPHISKLIPGIGLGTGLFASADLISTIAAATFAQYPGVGLLIPAFLHHLATATSDTP